MRDRPIPVDRALGILAGSVDCIPIKSISDHAGNLADLVEQTRHGLSASQRPFRILLMGGTGVGKSTVLNAFAGSTIAKTGAKRPTTEGFTVYLHEGENDPWLNTLHRVHITTHSRSELSGKAIIDSPDVDSIISEHRKILEEALGFVDMALVVVTAEKYVSESVIRLIQQYRQGRSFAFVFNKRDLYPERTLLEDLFNFLRTNPSTPAPVEDKTVDRMNGRSPSMMTGDDMQRFFHISAQSAYEARISGTEVERGFKDLEEWIGEKLHRHHRTEIIRTNLGERIDIVTRFVRRILPPAWETMDAEWRNGCAARFTTYLRELSDILQRDLFRIRDIADTIAEIRGSSFGGFYGIISDIVYAVHAFRRSRLVSRIVGVDQWIRTRMTQEDWERFDARDRLLTTTCVQFGKNIGLSEPFLRKTFVQQLELTESVGEWLRPRCVEGLARNLERESTPPGFLFNILANTPGFLWFAYWLYRIIHAVIQGKSPPWEAIPGAAVLLGFFLMFQWWLTNRFLRWEAKRRARRLVSSMMSDIEARYLKQHESAVETVSSALRKCVDRLRLALDTLEEMVIDK